MDSCSKRGMSDGELVRGFNELHYSNGGEPMFDQYNGISIVAAGDGWAEGELEVSRHSLNPHGIVHGGALAALADTVGGAATVAAYRRGCVTVNYSMNFLRPAWGSNRKIRCRAQAVKLGRTLSVFGMSLTDDEGVEVASGNFTFYITGWMKSEEEKEPGAI